MLSKSLILAFCRILGHTEPSGNDQATHKSLVAKWLDHLASVPKVLGSTPVGTRIFFFSSANGLVGTGNWVIEQFSI